MGRRIRHSVLEPGCLLKANVSFEKARGRPFSVENGVDQLCSVLLQTSQKN